MGLPQGPCARWWWATSGFGDTRPCTVDLPTYVDRQVEILLLTSLFLECSLILLNCFTPAHLLKGFVDHYHPSVRREQLHAGCRSCIGLERLVGFVPWRHVVVDVEHGIRHRHDGASFRWRVLQM